MKTINIRIPIWKYKAIGIAEWKATDDFEIKISYRTKDKELLYPDTYFITKEELVRFPLKYLGGLFVYVVPIEKLHIKKESKNVRR